MGMYVRDVNGIFSFATTMSNSSKDDGNDNGNDNANVYSPGVDFCWEDKTATKPESTLCWLSLPEPNCIPCISI